MQRKTLSPNQIITLRDYPVYNKHILCIYFLIFKKGQGKILPPCPVIHKSSGIPYVKSKDTKSKSYNALLQSYLENNPKAEYFLLDGGHKTAAAALSHKKIPVLILENNKDLKTVRKLMRSGEFLGLYTMETSMKAVIRELTKHFFGTKEFLTVEDKVKRMVQYKDIPAHLISYYKNAT